MEEKDGLTGEPQPEEGAEVTPEETPPETETPEKEEKEVVEVVDDKPKPTKHVPPPGHERWNEVYKELRDTGRKSAEQAETIKTFGEHNKNLQDALDQMEDRFDEQNIPDPVEDKEKHAEYISRIARKQIERQNRPSPIPKPPPQPQRPAIDRMRERVNTQIETMQLEHPDYFDVVDPVEREMANDPILKKEIWSSPNPPHAIYDYGKKKMAAAEKKRTQGIKQGHVEGGTLPAGKGGTTSLTPEQKTVAAKLGVSEKNYAKQLEHIQGGK